MLRCSAKRLLHLVPALLGVSLALFLILRAGDADPALSRRRAAGVPPTDAALAHAREELGLDRPLALQYLAWLAGAARLDFGNSTATGKPVLPEFLRLLPRTLSLAGAALALALAAGLPAGVAAAVWRGRWPDRLGRVLAALAASAPGYALGFLLMLVFSVRLGWLPLTGGLLLPAVTVALPAAALNTRLLRGVLIHELRARPVLYARVRGVGEGGVLLRHALRNALPPLLAALGMHTGEILGGAVVAEIVFARPGVGRYAVTAIMNRDLPAMQCFIMMMTALFALATLAADILSAAADPRIRPEEKERA